MANFGLSRPTIAKLNVETGKYSDAFKCGHAINTSITPNYNSASLYGDNTQQEQVDEFSNAKVELGIDTLPIKAAELLFGHKITEDGNEIDSTEDFGSYVGYGFITVERQKGKNKYRACLLTKVTFTEGAESYQTKGNNIQFGTPALSGVATGNDDGTWRIKSPYLKSEKECDEWILKMLGLDQEQPGGGTDGNGTEQPGGGSGSAGTGPEQSESNTEESGGTDADTGV